MGGLFIYLFICKVFKTSAPVPASLYSSEWGLVRDRFEWEMSTCEEPQMTGLVACSIAYVADVVYSNIWVTHQNT